MMTQNETNFSEAVLYSLLSVISERSPSVIKVKDIQKLSGYSMRHLTRLFLKHTGVRPLEYIKIIQMYRFLLEIKFTTSTYNDLCKKYTIKDIANFKANFKKITGLNIEHIKSSTNINFKEINKRNKINLSREFLSCSFISLFDCNVNARGFFYTYKCSVDNIMSSHYELVERSINEFCLQFSLQRNDVWTCAKFIPYDKDNYQVIIAPFVMNSNDDLPECRTLSLQNDYLLFTWVGKHQDTFPIIKNIYDLFFLKYGLIRRDGFDIIKRRKMEGVRGFYIYSYYIPVVLNELILSAIENK